MTNRLSRQQLLSIWGPLEDPATQEKDRDSDIENLILLARFNGGNKIAHKTITYLNDRQVLVTVIKSNLKLILTKNSFENASKQSCHSKPNCNGLSDNFAARTIDVK